MLENSQLKALLLQSEEPVDKIRPNACPLCDGWESDLNHLNQDAKRLHLNGGKVVEPYGTLKQFRRHLGRHMEQLALFALPIKESDDLEDDSADEADGNDSDSIEDAPRTIPDTAEEIKLPPATSETAVREIEAIMSHFRNAILPLCHQFIYAPPTDPKKRDIEGMRLCDMIIKEVNARIYEVKTDRTSETYRKMVSSIEEVRDVLVGLRRAMMMANDSVAGSSSDGQNSSEQGESTTMSEHQHRPNSASGSQPYDGFIKGKEMDNESQVGDSILQDYMKAINVASEEESAPKKALEADAEEGNKDAFKHTEDAKSYAAKEHGRTDRKSIRFKDALGKNHIFPFDSCSTWAVRSFPLLFEINGANKS